MKHSKYFLTENHPVDTMSRAQKSAIIEGYIIHMHEGKNSYEYEEK